MCVINLDKDIFVCGGQDDSSTLASVEKYSVETDMWTFASPMNFERTNFSIVILGRYLYAIGGICKGIVLDKVKMYRIIANAPITIDFK